MQKSVAVFSLCASLIGCSSLEPALPPINPVTPPGWFDTTPSSVQRPRWTDLFASKDVIRDVNLAIHQNRDIARAGLVALRSRQLIGTAPSPFVVSLSAEGNYAGPLENCCVYTKNDYGLIGLSFDLDIWNKIEMTTKSSTLEAEAAGITVEEVQSAIAAGVIRAYTVIAYANDYLTVIEEMDRVLAYLEHQSRSRSVSGMPNSADLSRVLLKRSELASSKARVEQQKAAAIESLRLLTDYRQNVNSIELKLADIAPTTYTIPETVGVDVLLARPDVRAADKRMRAANVEIGIAKADRLPRVSLPIDLIFGNGRSLWEAMPTITQVLFDGGRLKAVEDASVTGRDIAIKDYEIAIQRAFRDVSNGIANSKTMESETEIASRSLTLSQRAFDRTRARYRAGYEDLSELFDRFDDLLRAKVHIVETGLARTNSAIDLFVAIGTGV